MTHVLSTRHFYFHALYHRLVPLVQYPRKYNLYNVLLGAEKSLYSVGTVGTYGPAPTYGGTGTVPTYSLEVSLSRVFRYLCTYIVSTV